jgi:type I restriction enzyme, R subunit
MLVNGVDVEFQGQNGETVYDKVWLFDFEEPLENEFLAINQFTIIEDGNNRRPDIILFVNGLPLVVVELKRPDGENGFEDEEIIWDAYKQFQTYKKEIPAFFRYNSFLLISDGQDARAGTLTSSREWFVPWKTIDGEKVADFKIPPMEVLLRGCAGRKFSLTLSGILLFLKTTGKGLSRNLPGTTSTMQLIGLWRRRNLPLYPKGIESAGLSGTRKDRESAFPWFFYAGKLALGLDNPTIVVLMNRNDLDGQLFENFARCSEILRQKPVQAETRAHLRELLAVASGGIVFTTIQKFSPEGEEDQFPTLSERKKIIVIADEAHRSQSSGKTQVLTGHSEKTSRQR